MVTTRTLQETYKQEIIHAFNVFDEKRTGIITPNSLKLLMRALGFRVTKNQVFQDAIEAKRRLGRDANDNDNDNDVDLDVVLDIMETKYNKNLDASAETKINFRLFDLESKGYITAADLQRVIAELNRECHDMGLEGIRDLREEQLRAMIDEFDANLDSVIDFAEFKRIMEFAA